MGTYVGGYQVTSALAFLPWAERGRICLPPFTPLEPLHRYKLGKLGSKLRSHPLQTRYKAVT